MALFRKKKPTGETRKAPDAPAGEGEIKILGLADILEPRQPADDAEQTRIKEGSAPPTLAAVDAERTHLRSPSTEERTRIRPPSTEERTRIRPPSTESERTRIRPSSADGARTGPPPLPTARRRPTPRAVHEPRPPAGAPPGDPDRTHLTPPPIDIDGARLRRPALESERTRIRSASFPVVDPEETRLRHPADSGEQTRLRDEPASEAAEQPRRRPTGRDDLVESALPQGTVVGRYLLLERIGVGGMGSVYRAYDPELDRRVAVKLLHGQREAGSSGNDHRGRLLREAQAMARLNHPAIVTVHDVGLHDDQVFMAMEFVEGITLREWIREKQRPWREVLEVMAQAGRGIAAAHTAGLIHRDFKPSNVIIDPTGRVKVLDFGLARRAQADAEGADAAPESPTAAELAQGEISISISASRSSLDMQLTHAGAIMGSPAYMSPEQHMGRETDPRSDQFSFCVTLFEALYGERPFVSEDHRTLVYAILEQRIRSTPRDSKVPRAIHRAVLRGLAVNPQDRYPTLDDLLADLRHDARRPLRWVFGGMATVTVLAAALAIAWPRAVTDESLAQVDAVADVARDAAARSLFIYPPPDQPDTPTAYSAVLELEAMQGELEEPARARAAELRSELAQTLVYLGDRYWEKEEGKAFAIDYYAQALVFDEANEHAGERAALTVGQLADLRRKADAADFSTSELAAAEPLLALAEDDEAKRAEKLEQILASPQAERSAAAEARLSRLAESTAAEAPERKAKAKPKPKPKPRDDDVELVVDNDGETAQVKRVASERKRDPDKAKALAADGHAKLKAALLADARGLFHQALSYDRRCASALIGLSDVHFDLGEHSKAIEYAERAVAVAPRSGSYRIRLGDAYFKALRYDDAKAEYEAAKARGDSRAEGRLQKIGRTLGGG